jgi:hypothetical protein
VKCPAVPPLLAVSINAEITPDVVILAAVKPR